KHVFKEKSELVTTSNDKNTTTVLRIAFSMLDHKYAYPKKNLPHISITIWIKTQCHRCVIAVATSTVIGCTGAATTSTATKLYHSCGCYILCIVVIIVTIR